MSLNLEYLLIVDNGTLQIGTEQVPFKHRAVVTMFGHVRSTELPIYGSKVIGLRSGVIDMHGQPIGVTWTHLGTTAKAGQTNITLKEPVNWPVGSEIVIATTGDKFSQGESETAIVTAISGYTLLLDRALKATHLSVTRTVGGGETSVEIRAEVGLLSRNVVFRGHRDESWTRLKTADACPDRFDPGEFATQTCFLGRYGPELGSDEFGAQILIASPMIAHNKQAATARISNVELTHVGQAFRKGRYPIHFHMNGDMQGSYVK